MMIKTKKNSKDKEEEVPKSKEPYFAGIRENTNENSCYYALQLMSRDSVLFMNFGDDLGRMGRYIAEEFGSDFRDKITYKRPLWSQFSTAENHHLRSHLLSPMERKLLEKRVVDVLDRKSKESGEIYLYSKTRHKVEGPLAMLGFLFNIESARIVSEEGRKEKTLLLNLIKASNKDIKYNHKINGNDRIYNFIDELGAENIKNIIGREVIGFPENNAKYLRGLSVPK